jgi:hypothetical protein
MIKGPEGFPPSSGFYFGIKKDTHGIPRVLVFFMAEYLIWLTSIGKRNF